MWNLNPLIIKSLFVLCHIWVPGVVGFPHQSQEDMYVTPSLCMWWVVKQLQPLYGIQHNFSLFFYMAVLKTMEKAPGKWNFQNFNLAPLSIYFFFARAILNSSNKSAGVLYFTHIEKIESQKASVPRPSGRGGLARGSSEANHTSPTSPGRNL